MTTPLPQTIDVYPAVVDGESDAALPVEARAAARLLEYRRGQFVAFPAHATMELVAHPVLMVVPGSPYYCQGLMAWQGRQIPLLDLNTLLRAYPDERAPAIDHVLVLAYQRAPRQPLDYGAVCAPALLQMIEVADSQQCALPNHSDLWPLIAGSCFQHAGNVVPVLDTARLFAQAYL
jgi:chemotaxis signal transduction protein